MAIEKSQVMAFRGISRAKLYIIEVFTDIAAKSVCLDNFTKAKNSVLTDLP